jgi:hypothetical protein
VTGPVTCGLGGFGGFLWGNVQWLPWLGSTYHSRGNGWGQVHQLACGQATVRGKAPSDVGMAPDDTGMVPDDVEGTLSDVPLIP